MAALFDEIAFEKKLSAIKDTQDSIQSLSSWCLKHHQYHKEIVATWLRILKKCKIEQRLSLFYLANDVIQHSKRKSYAFVDSWATALQRATPLVREDKVRNKILRLFKIWDERSIYDESFIVDLSGLLATKVKKPSEKQEGSDSVSEFQPSLLFSKIRSCKRLEDDTDNKLKTLQADCLPMTNVDLLQTTIKERKDGDVVLSELDNGIEKMEAYIKALKQEIKERVQVIEILEVSEIFYETQRGEAKIVCNAYRNFANRIKTLRKKLEETINRVSTPISSPDINAPSPSSGSDFGFPDDINLSREVTYDTEQSFIGMDFESASREFQLNKSSYSESSDISDYSVNQATSYIPTSLPYTPTVLSSFSGGGGMMDKDAASSCNQFTTAPPDIWNTSLEQQFEASMSNTQDNDSYENIDCLRSPNQSVMRHSIPTMEVDETGRRKLGNNIELVNSIDCDNSLIGSTNFFKSLIEPQQSDMIIGKPARHHSEMIPGLDFEIPASVANSFPSFLLNEHNINFEDEYDPSQEFDSSLMSSSDSHTNKHFENNLPNNKNLITLTTDQSQSTSRQLDQRALSSLEHEKIMLIDNMKYSPLSDDDAPFNTDLPGHFKNYAATNSLTKPNIENVDMEMSDEEAEKNADRYNKLKRYFQTDKRSPSRTSIDKKRRKSSSSNCRNLHGQNATSNLTHLYGFSDHVEIRNNSDNVKPIECISGRSNFNYEISKNNAETFASNKVSNFALINKPNHSNLKEISLNNDNDLITTVAPAPMMADLSKPPPGFDPKTLPKFESDQQHFSKDRANQSSPSILLQQSQQQSNDFVANISAAADFKLHHPLNELSSGTVEMLEFNVPPLINMLDDCANVENPILIGPITQSQATIPIQFFSRPDTAVAAADQLPFGLTTLINHQPPGLLIPISTTPQTLPLIVNSPRETSNFHPAEPIVAFTAAGAPEKIVIPPASSSSSNNDGFLSTTSVAVSSSAGVVGMINSPLKSAAPVQSTSPRNKNNFECQSNATDAATGSSQSNNIHNDGIPVFETSAAAAAASINFPSSTAADSSIIYSTSDTEPSFRFHKNDSIALQSSEEMIKNQRSDFSFDDFKNKNNFDTNTTSSESIDSPPVGSADCSPNFRFPTRFRFQYANGPRHRFQQHLPDWPRPRFQHAADRPRCFVSRGAAGPYQQESPRRFPMNVRNANISNGMRTMRPRFPPRDNHFRRGW